MRKLGLICYLEFRKIFSLPDLGKVTVDMQTGQLEKSNHYKEWKSIFNM